MFSMIINKVSAKNFGVSANRKILGTMQDGIPQKKKKSVQFSSFQKGMAENFEIYSRKVWEKFISEL